MISAAAARGHLEALAGEPRPAGGPAEARAREYCAGILRGAGMRVSEESFSYSAFPGLWATPVFGVVSMLALVAGLAAGWLGRPGAGLAILALALASMALAGIWLARRGVVQLPWLRRQGINLVARRGDGEPRVWLMAHLDSKSQPVPMLLRAGGITLTALVWIASLGLLAARAQGAVGPEWIPWLALTGIVSAAPIAASLVGARSPGAVDDASGVVTVLLAAESEPALSLGVVLTSAEELGLAGARGWALAHPASVALNCDGVDDAGALAAMWSGRMPRRLLDSFALAARRAGVSARQHRVLPGVLVDGVALADAGWEVITMSRGTVATLRRIHTPGDSLEAMSGAGIPDAARVMASMARELAG